MLFTNDKIFSHFNEISELDGVAPLVGGTCVQVADEKQKSMHFGRPTDLLGLLTRSRGY